ncbi:MAG: hypothetical protein JXM70_19855 [Pirellulales bacterium]|nr:hypothetical protein [Pirellulales bacterium]
MTDNLSQKTDSDETTTPQENSTEEPKVESIRNFLLYSLSIPERALRSGSGVLGGALRESAAMLVPRAFQNSKTYSVMVRQMLDFMAEDIGGVAHSEDPDAPVPIENYVARKTIGNFVEIAGMATMHISPLMFLAIFSDIAYGSQAYLQEVAEELKKEGIIDEKSTIHRVDDLLEALAGMSETAATAFDTPPLSVEGLRETVSQTREAAQSIDPVSVMPQAELKQLWDDIHQIAADEGVNPFAVSSAMTLYSLKHIATLGQGALSTVRVAGTLLDRHVIDHYRAGLEDIRAKGIYASLSETSQPYIEAVWLNFSGEKTTITEDILSGRMIGRAWNAVGQWLGGTKNE